MRQSSGFTLLEVLVALAVLALALSASIHAATQSIISTEILRDRSLASWVALNEINQRLINPAPWPDEGTEHGTHELAQRTWYWELRFSKTADPELRSLDITVRSDAQQVMINLSAFRAQALTSNLGSAEQKKAAPR